MIVFYLFILLNAIIIYSMIVMWKFEDLSYLSVLITDIAAQIIVSISHMIKSTKENTVGGIVFETVIREQNNIPEESDNEETEN